MAVKGRTPLVARQPYIYIYKKKKNPQNVTRPYHSYRSHKATAKNKKKKTPSVRPPSCCAPLRHRRPPPTPPLSMSPPPPSSSPLHPYAPMRSSYVGGGGGVGTRVFLYTTVPATSASNTPPPTAAPIIMPVSLSSSSPLVGSVPVPLVPLPPLVSSVDAGSSVPSDDDDGITVDGGSVGAVAGAHVTLISPL